MERKSPKFYVADGIVLRMREAIAYVIDHVEHVGSGKERAIDALRKRTFGTLDTLHYSGVITEDEGLELKLKLSNLLNKDDEERASKTKPTPKG